MSQEEIINYMKKKKDYVTSRQIISDLKLSPSSVANSLLKIKKYNEAIFYKENNIYYYKSREMIK